MIFCAKGHKVRVPVIGIGKFPTIVCWECVAGK